MANQNCGGKARGPASAVHELAVESVRLGGVTLPPLLSVVVGLLGAGLLLANTRFRRIP